jgi:uncharacterized protein (TIGR02246 family)
MKIMFSGMMCLMFLVPNVAQCADRETPVREAVQAFYAAYAHGFINGADAFATPDWNHINPSGGRTKGREAVLKEVVEVHTTFLKGVTDTVDTLDVRFATPNAAVATVASHMSPFTSPDGVKHANQKLIRTFAVVKRSGRWLIMQDQSTFIAP